MLVVMPPIGLIMAGAQLIKQNWEPISGFFVALWDTVKIAAAAGWEFVQFIVLKPIAMIRSGWASITGWFSEQWTAISTGALGALGPIPGFFESAWNRIVAITKPIHTFFDDFWGALSKTVGGFFDKLTGGLEKIQGFFGGIRDVFKSENAQLKAELGIGGNTETQTTAVSPVNTFEIVPVDIGENAIGENQRAAPVVIEGATETIAAESPIDAGTAERAFSVETLSHDGETTAVGETPIQTIPQAPVEVQSAPEALPAVTERQPFRFPVLPMPVDIQKVSVPLAETTENQQTTTETIQKATPPPSNVIDLVSRTLGNPDTENQPTQATDIPQVVQTPTPIEPISVFQNEAGVPVVENIQQATPPPSNVIDLVSRTLEDDIQTGVNDGEEIQPVTPILPAPIAVEDISPVPVQVQFSDIPPELLTDAGTQTEIIKNITFNIENSFDISTVEDTEALQQQIAEAVRQGVEEALESYKTGSYAA